MEAIGNFFQAIYMFFYNSGYVIWSTLLFLGFFAIEIILILIYWKVGSALYNNIMPMLKKAKEFFEKVG